MSGAGVRNKLDTDNSRDSGDQGKHWVDAGTREERGKVTQMLNRGINVKKLRRRSRKGGMG